MSNAEVKLPIVTQWTEWMDADFYLLKLRLDRIEGIGFLYYFLHPKEALRDLKLWFRFTMFVKKVKKQRAKTYFTGTLYCLPEVKKSPSLFSHIKAWFKKKPKIESRSEYLDRLVKERAEDKEEDKKLEEALSKLTEVLEKHESKDEQKPIDEKDKKE